MDAVQERRTVVVCGPQLSAIGGGPTHINNVLSSPLSRRFRLVHFEIGSRGAESPAVGERVVTKLWRIMVTPGRFLRAILVERPAVVHVNTSLNHKSFWRDAVLMLLSRMFQRRVVCQIHGGSLIAFCRARAMRAVAKLVFGMADVVIVLSSTERDNFEHLISVAKVRRIQNAIDLSCYQAGERRAHLGSVSSLAYLGRLDREKGLFEALDAFAILKTYPQFAQATFLLAGTGPARDDLERRICELRLVECVRLVGRVSGNAKTAFLKMADVFVFPSYHEGLPYALLESIAAGTPVVASRVGGIPDVVIDGEHGVLIEPRSPMDIVQAILRLSDPKTDLRSMSAECGRWANERFGLDRLADELGSAYDDAPIGPARTKTPAGDQKKFGADTLGRRALRVNRGQHSGRT